MGKIIKLKNKKTGEHVYPVSVTKAIADPDSGERLNDILLNKVEEAPIDGEQYARINGAWAKVEGGGDETALITLLPNNDSIIGATVKVTTAAGETLLNTTWQGAALSVQIPSGVEYTITVGAKDGFITPSPQTYTATKGATRSVSLTYQASTLTVKILSNQDNDSAISSVKATVSYGSTSLQVSNGQKISLPLNANVKITFPSVTDYKAPSEINFTHTGGAVEKNGTYQTEIVNVSLSSDNGESVIGQTVTINNVTHTWNGTTISQKVAFGTSYKIKVSGKSGFTTPSPQNITASLKSRNISLVFKEIFHGAYIQGISGKKYKVEDWNNQEVPNGVAFFEDEVNVVIALQELPNQYDWDDNVANTEAGGTVISGVSVFEDEDGALGDFNGKTNTNKIISALGSAAQAANACANYTFPNGKKGYLPSAGELAMVSNSKVNEALKACGGSTLNRDRWTSTQARAGAAWEFDQNDEFRISNKGLSKYVRPFTEV